MVIEVRRVADSGDGSGKEDFFKEGIRESFGMMDSFVSCTHLSKLILLLFKVFFFFNVTFLKVFTEFVTMLLLFYDLVFWPQGMWDLSTPTRDQTLTNSIGRRSLNH